MIKTIKNEDIIEESSKQATFQLHPKNCHFFQSRVKYFAFIVSSSGIEWAALYLRTLHILSTIWEELRRYCLLPSRTDREESLVSVDIRKWNNILRFKNKIMRGTSTSISDTRKVVYLGYESKLGWRRWYSAPANKWKIKSIGILRPEVHQRRTKLLHHEGQRFKLGTGHAALKWLNNFKNPMQKNEVIRKSIYRLNKPNPLLSWGNSSGNYVYIYKIEK